MKFAENCQILTKISFNLTQKLNNILSYITKIMPKISAVEESQKIGLFIIQLRITLTAHKDKTLFYH